MLGVIDRLVPAEGFGFIEGEDGREYFLHVSALSATEFEELAPGSAVEFSVSDGDQGDEPGEHVRAANIRLAPAQMPAIENEPLPPEKLNP